MCSGEKIGAFHMCTKQLIPYHFLCIMYSCYEAKTPYYIYTPFHVHLRTLDSGRTGK